MMLNHPVRQTASRLYATLTSMTRPVRSERGASAVEYALLIAAVAIGCIGAVEIFQPLLQAIFESSMPPPLVP